jgi:hypothetical protein
LTKKKKKKKKKKKEERKRGEKKKDRFRSNLRGGCAHVVVIFRCVSTDLSFSRGIINIAPNGKTAILYIPGAFETVVSSALVKIE